MVVYTPPPIPEIPVRLWSDSGCCKVFISATNCLITQEILLKLGMLIVTYMSKQIILCNMILV
jgi:hypothetical protein